MDFKTDIEKDPGILLRGLRRDIILMAEHSAHVAVSLSCVDIIAALYFGVIIPLSAANSSPFFLPLLYGLGTALPVIAIAVALDLGLKTMPAMLGLAAGFGKYAKPATGWVFIAVGVYMGLRYIFNLV